MGFSLNANVITGHPPLIVFTICLAAFGFTMVVLAYVVGEQDVPNPDVQMDWNKFFKRMSDLHLCPLQNLTKHSGKYRIPIVIFHPESTSNSSSRVVDESKSMSAVLSDVVDSAMDKSWQESAFVEVSVKAIFGLKGKLLSDSRFSLKGTLKGKLLGLPGKYSHLLYNVTLNFRPIRNRSCVGEKCSSVFEVCISLSLPSDVIPKTKMPDSCKIKKSSLYKVLPIQFSEVPVLDTEDSSTTCIELDYTPNAKLTEMLSPHDRSIVNLHLMHTSYFMFVMVMTLVCFSLVKGKFRQPKNYHALQKVPSEA